MRPHVLAIVASGFLLSAAAAEDLVALRADAMKALQGLRSIASAGVTYRDYAPRVLDAKIIVDRYLLQPGAREEVAYTPIDMALRFYVLASRAWNVQIRQSGYEVIAKDPLLPECPPIQALIRAGAELPIADVLRKLHYTDTMIAGIAVASGVPALWQCAGEQLAAAESG
jgi:hypothetical protein